MMDSLQPLSKHGHSWLLILILVISACGSIENPEQAVPLLTPTLPARTDVQTPGLVELVDAQKTAPYMPPEPSQADLGAEVYFQICLACHGDWGQGLTEEWRDTWGEDKNCWQSKCHAPNHPPWGFEIPKYAPPLLGVGSLSRYHTAGELHANIAKTMPWWNPGSLTEDQAWQVAAYLLRERGELSNDITIDESTAPVIQMHNPAAEPVDHFRGVYFYIGILAFVGIAILWNSAHEINLLRNRHKPRIPVNPQGPSGDIQSGEG